MTDVLGLMGLLALFFLGRDNAAAPAARPQTAPRARRPRPGLPSGGAAASLPPGPAPWPQALPEGLPPFPGSGWEFDEPPPPAVQQRAAQLVAPLWRQGKGSSRTELTAGRWITYRAEIVRSGKQGVVAYRVRRSGTTSSPAPAAPQTTARAPSSASSWTIQQILTSSSAGWPQPMQGGAVVQLVPGRWYQWKARFDVRVPIANPKQFAQEIARGLALGGAVNIAVSDSQPFQVSYQLQAKNAAVVPLGVAIGVKVDGIDASITFLEGREIQAPDGPKVPAPPIAQAPRAPGTYARTTPTSSALPVTRDLKIGDRGDDVRVVQRRLGVPDDGIFGLKTQTAVIEFQRDRGLAPNLPTEQLRARGFGAVLQATRNALFAPQRA